MNYTNVLDDDMTYEEMTDLLDRLESILWSRQKNSNDLYEPVHNLWAHVNQAWKTAERAHKTTPYQPSND